MPLITLPADWQCKVECIIGGSSFYFINYWFSFNSPQFRFPLRFRVTISARMLPSIHPLPGIVIRFIWMQRTLFLLLLPISAIWSVECTQSNAPDMLNFVSLNYDRREIQKITFSNGVAMEMASLQWKLWKILIPLQKRFSTRPWRLQNTFRA